MKTADASFGLHSGYTINQRAAEEIVLAPLLQKLWLCTLSMEVCSAGAPTPDNTK